MSLPNVTEFEEFIAGTRVVTEQPSGTSYEHLSTSTSSELGPGAELWLEYPTGRLQFDSVCRKISDALAASHSPSTRTIAAAVLALVAETKGTERHVEHANTVLSTLHSVDASLNFVLPRSPSIVDLDFDFGPLRSGEFDPSKLLFRAEKGGSAWPRDLNALRGHPVFHAPLRRIPLINATNIPGIERLFKRRDVAAGAVIDAYYQGVVTSLIERVSNDTRNAFSLMEAADLATLDLGMLTRFSEEFHLLSWPSSESTRAGSWGVHRLPRVEIHIPPADKWKRSKAWLDAEFGVTSLPGGDGAFEVAAQTFGALVQDARGHRANGRTREAFLYLVVALDTLLGEEGRSVDTVARRTAALTHLASSAPFETEVKRIKLLYGTRSRFVHAGSPVTDADVQEANGLAVDVLWALVRAVQSRRFGAPDEWLASIDKLSYLLMGDPSLVSDDHFSAVGVARNFKNGGPP